MAGPINAFEVNAGVTTGNLTCNFSNSASINACAITSVTTASTTAFVVITLTVDTVTTT